MLSGVPGREGPNSQENLEKRLHTKARAKEESGWHGEGERVPGRAFRIQAAQVTLTKTKGKGRPSLLGLKGCSILALRQETMVALLTCSRAYPKETKATTKCSNIPYPTESTTTKQLP